MTTKELTNIKLTIATELVERVKYELSACAWGDKYPEAHKQLFDNYHKDLCDIAFDTIELYETDLFMEYDGDI